MRYMAFNVADQWTTVLDTEAGEVLFYDARHRGDEPRGSRRSFEWTPDGRFVASYDVEIAREWRTGLDLYGGEDDWMVPIASVRLVATWVDGIQRGGDYPTGDGMSFIGNQWVYSGPFGYRVRKRDDGMFNVVSYAGSAERVAGPFALGLTRDSAYALAATLANGR